MLVTAGREEEKEERCFGGKFLEMKSKAFSTAIR
jgi:hypothetical protein